MILPGELASAWAGPALCRSVDPERFFPIAYRYRDVAPAQQICHRCPVAEQCLDTAVAARDYQHGIWGGLTPLDRRTLLDGGRRWTCPDCGFVRVLVWPTPCPCRDPSTW
jgi:WhiB family transcriptional regulator, redox-sensing transcriptional regulator